jgi:hypothetical protein
MPSTSDEQRARWPGGDAEAVRVLERAGYRLNQYWSWEAPEGHVPTARELDAIGYLVHEWDYGTLVRATPVQMHSIWNSPWEEPGQ